jgi:hypothetical protein
VSIEARDSTTERFVATGRFGTGTAGYRQLKAVARQWPQRTWAMEGTAGTGRPVARRLVADGEAVLDVPAKLAARSRVFDTGQGGTTRDDWAGRGATRACGRRGRNHAVDRPAVPDHDQVRPGLGRRLHGRPQAGPETPLDPYLLAEMVQEAQIPSA